MRLDRYPRPHATTRRGFRVGRSGNPRHMETTSTTTSDPPDLRLELPVAPESVAAARHAVRELGMQTGAPPDLLDRIALAVTEAVTGAVRQGFRHVGGPRATRVELEAAHRGEALVVAVRDYGIELTPRFVDPGAGLGLPIVAACASAIEIDRSAGGGRTALVMAFAL